VKLSDGGVRNGYTIKLLNKLYEPHAFRLGVEGLAGATLSVIGHDNETDPVVTVPPDQLEQVRLYVTLDKKGVAALPGTATDFSFVITDIANGMRTEHEATFQGPER
jgi:polyferredoxin